MQSNEVFGFGASQAAQSPVAPAFTPNAAPSNASAFGVGIPANREDIFDANRRRLLFVCGFNQIELTQQISGLTTPFLPNGTLIKTVAARLAMPTYEIDDENKDSSKLVDFSAKVFHDNIIQKTTTDPDYGVRSLSMLVGLSYKEKFENGQHIIFEDLADAYLDVLYPSVATRGAQYVCPEGLSDCPTCSLKWLQSADCEKRYFQALENQADQTILQHLHTKLVESVKATLAHANRMWSGPNGILFDIKQAKSDKPGKNALSDTDHHIRKMLHAVAPDMEQTNAIIEGSRETARAMAGANAEAMKEAFAPFVSLLQQNGVVQPAAPVARDEENERLKAENETLKTQNAEIINQNNEILRMMREKLFAQSDETQTADGEKSEVTTPAPDEATGKTKKSNK